MWHAEGVAAGFISGLVWFSIFVALHLAAFAIGFAQPRFKPLAAFGLLSAAGAAVCGWLAGEPGAESAVAAASAVLTFASLLVLYMPFYYTIVASLSVRTLIALSATGDRGAPLSDLERQFASPDIVAARLETMRENGYIVRVGEGFVLTGKGRLVASIFRGVKRLWALGPGG